ncbi:MAG: hypothetical protein ACRDT4_11080 [Micromonosporaceae bacterium]
MTPSLVVVDLGDVLVRTCPGAQYTALERLTGTPASQWATAADHSGLVPALEDGRIDFPTFTRCLATRAGSKPLPPQGAEDAWNAVIVGLDTHVAAAAALLAGQGRLLLASNTSPPHYARIRPLLAEAGIRAPACLSYKVGHRKPADAFFQALAAADPRVARNGVFIDDRAEHVAAAARHRMRARRHHDPRATAAYLRQLADDLPTPPKITTERLSQR